MSQHILNLEAMVVGREGVLGEEERY